MARQQKASLISALLSSVAGAGAASLREKRRATHRARKAAQVRPKKDIQGQKNLLEQAASYQSLLERIYKR